jgi:hypothetical protein
VVFGDDEVARRCATVKRLREPDGDAQGGRQDVVALDALAEHLLRALVEDDDNGGNAG